MTILSMWNGDGYTPAAESAYNRTPGVQTMAPVDITPACVELITPTSAYYSIYPGFGLRNGLQLARYSNSGYPYSVGYRLNQNTVPAAYRSGKLYFCFRAYAPGGGAAVSVGVDGAARTYPNLRQSLKTPQFFEVIVNYTAKNVGVWSDGELLGAKAFTTAFEVVVGSLSEQGPSMAGLGTYLYLNDIYVVSDYDGDPTPTGRIGPATVQSLPVTGIMGGDGWPSVANDVALANGKVDLSATARTPFTPPATSSATGTAAEFKFATDTVPDNIVGVQLQFTASRNADALAQARYSFLGGEEVKMGTVQLPNKDTAATPSMVRTVLQHPTSGTTWDKDAVAALGVRLNSERLSG